MVDRNELTSAFMDGELNQKEVNELLADLYTNEDLRARWQRYHLIGEALRNNLPSSINTDLASRVSAAIQDEPAILAPHSTPAIQGNETKKQNKFKIGYAMAASLALVGFGAVLSLNKETATLQQVASHAVVPASVVDTKLHAVLAADSKQAMVIDRLEPKTSKIQSYVLEHEYSVAASSLRGLPPGVRVVTFSSER